MAEIKKKTEELTSVTLELTADEAAVLRHVSSGVTWQGGPGKAMKRIYDALGEVFPLGTVRHKALAGYRREGKIYYVTQETARLVDTFGPAISI